jgi:hypothetical protein
MLWLTGGAAHWCHTLGLTEEVVPGIAWPFRLADRLQMPDGESPQKFNVHADDLKSEVRRAEA